MKRSVGIVIGVVFVAGLVILAVVLSHTTSKSKGSSNTSSSSSYAAVDACSVLTSSVATQVLGSTAVKAATPPDQESTSDILVQRLYI